MYIFVVITMESEPYQVIRLKCGCVRTEKLIKERKDGFDFMLSAVQSLLIQTGSNGISFRKVYNSQAVRQLFIKNEFYGTLQNIWQFQPKLKSQQFPCTLTVL